MYYDDKVIQPFYGIDDIKIGDNYNSVIGKLKSHKIIYSSGVNPNKGCTPEVAWTTIYIKNYMELVFAKDVLWRIDFLENFAGKLENNIKIGMDLSMALAIDKELEYDDWNEEFYSKKGYWLIDSLETGKIVTIFIGIKEILNDDEFDSYNWVEKYKK